MSWPLVKIKDIFDVARGGSPRPIQDYLTDDPDGLNWVMIGDTKKGSKYIESTTKKIRKEGLKKTRQVKPGDFLLTNSMSFGRPYIMKTSGCVHDGWLILSPKSDQIFTDYFYHYIGSKEVYNRLAGKAAGAVVKNLNKDVVKELEIPLPPLSEQKRIAAILDKADQLRQKRQQAIGLADEFLRSVFLDMHKQSSELHSEHKFLDVALAAKNSFINGPFGSNLLSSELTDTGVPVVYIRDIREAEYNRISTVCVTEDKADELGTCNVTGGDVLVAKVGDPPGTSAVYPSTEPDAIVTQDVIRIRCNRAIVLPSYLSAYINSFHGKRVIDQIKVEATRSRVGLGDLKKQIIQLPPIDTQKKFDLLLNKVKATLLKQKRSEFQATLSFNSLSQKAFAGEL